MNLRVKPKIIFMKTKNNFSQKFLVFIFAAFFSLFFCNHLLAQFPKKISITALDIALVPCGESNVSFTLNGDISTGTTHFEVALPDGMSYLNGSLAVSTNLNLSNISVQNQTLKFDAYKIYKKEKIPTVHVFSFKLQSGCPADLPDSLQLIVNGTFTSFPGDNFPMNIPFSRPSGFFSMPAPELIVWQDSIIPNPFLTDQDIFFIRSIKVKNIGNAPLLNGFTLIDEHGYAVRIDSVQLAGTPNVFLANSNGSTAYILNITPAVLTSAGISGGAFLPNTTLTLLEYIKVTDCTVDSFGNDIAGAGLSNLEYFWECNGLRCDSNRVTAEVHTKQRPNLTFTPFSEDSICYNGATPYYQGFEIRNVGDAEAVRVHLQLSQVFPLTYMVPMSWQLLDSSGNMVIANFQPERFIKGNGQICTQDSAYTFLAFQLPDMPAGKKWLLRWQAITCCPEVCLKGGYWKNSWHCFGSYATKCLKDSFPINNFNVSSSGIFDHASIRTLSPWTPVMLGSDTSNPGWIADTTEFKTQLSSPRFWEGDDSAKIKVVWTLGSPLKYLPNTVSINNGLWLPELVTNVVTSGTDTVTAYFTFPPLPEPTISNAWGAYDLLFDKPELSITLTAECPPDPPTVLKQEIFFIPSAKDCSSCEVSLACKEKQITIYCPGCKKVGIFYTHFGFNRTNFGLPDHDDNGIANGGTLDTAQLKIHSAMVGDTFEFSANTDIRMSGYNPSPFQSVDGTPYSFRYGYFEFMPDCYDKLTPLGMLMYVTDSNGTDTARLPASAVRLVNIPQPHLLYDFSIDTLHNYNQLLGMDSFNRDDIFIDFKLLFQVTGNVGASEPVLCEAVVNKVYLGVAPFPYCDINCDSMPGTNCKKVICDSTVQYGCDELSATEPLMLIGYDFTNSVGFNSYPEGCEQIVSASYFYWMGDRVGAEPGGINSFPYEYRQWGFADTGIIVVPQGYDFVSADIVTGRTSGGQIFTQRKDTVFPDAVIGDTLLFLLRKHFTSDTAGAFIATNDSLYLSDDDFFTRLIAHFTARCNTPGKTDIGIYGGGNFEPDFAADTITDFSFRHSSSFQFIPPVLAVSAGIGEVQATEHFVCWEVRVENNGGRADHPWFNIQNPSGLFKVESVEDINGGNAVAMQLSGDLFQLSVIPGRSFSMFRICGSYQCPDGFPTDSIIVITGWDCPDFPDSLAVFACSPDDTATLKYNPEDAELTIDITAASSMNLCDSLPVTVHIKNTGAGTAYNLQVKIKTVSGLNIQSGSGQLQYPENSTFVTVKNPDTLSQFIYLWKLDELSDSFDVNANEGLPGSRQQTLDSLSMRFNMESDCDFKPGSVMEVEVSGVTNCGDTITRSAFFTPKINGVIAPVVGKSNRTLTITASNIKACGNTSTLSVTMKNTATNPGDMTKAGEKIFFVIPGCMSWNGTISPIKKEPTSYVLKGDTIIWDLPTGIKKDSISSFNFTLTVDSSSCGLLHGYYAVVTQLSQLINCGKVSSCRLDIIADTATGIIQQFPALQLALAVKNICFTENCTGKALASVTGGNPAYNFVWYDIFFPSVSIIQYGGDSIVGLCPPNFIYLLRVTDQDGCVVEENFNISQLSQLTVQAFSDTSNGNNTAWVSASGSQPPYSYQWSNGETTDTIKNLSGGTYTVTVTDSSDCTAVGTVSIVLPFAAGFSAPDTCITSPVVSFTNTTTPIGADYSFLWDFGDGTTSTDSMPVHTYSAVGTYTITLIATDIVSGISDTATRQVKIFSTSGAQIPGANCCSGNFVYDLTGNFIIDNQSKINSLLNLFVNDSLSVSDTIFIGTTDYTNPQFKLTLSGKTIQFGPRGRIIVRSKDTLELLNGTKLTGLLSCNTMWTGIEAQGIHPLGNPFALIKIDGSTIENAHIAVLCANSEIAFVYGGKVEASNSKFKTNGIDIKGFFSQGINVANSVFEGGVLPDSGYNANHTGYKYPIPFFAPYYGNANNSGRTYTHISGGENFLSFPISVTGSKLNESEYGMRIQGSGNLFIAGNNFSDINGGIYLQGNGSAIISHDTFNVVTADTNDTYGIFAVGSNGFAIDSNEFIGIGSGGTSHDRVPNAYPASYGVVVENSSTGGGIVFDNNFDGLNFQIQSQEDNSVLKIRCNDFKDASNNAWVTFDELKQQGEQCNLAGTNAENLAGNEWTVGGMACLSGTPMDIYYDNIPFKYFAHEFDEFANKYITDPDSCTNLLTDTSQLNVCNLQKTPQSCGSAFDGLAPPGGGDDCSDYIREIQQQINSWETQINGAKAQLRKIDGGNTADLIQLINQDPPVSAIFLTNKLLASLPLSEQVLLALLHRKYPLPPSDMEGILVDNSRLPEIVMHEVREHPLPPPNMQRIEAAQNKPLFLQTKELQELIAYLDAEIQFLEDELLRTSQSCETSGQTKQHLIELPHIEPKKRLAEILLSENNFTDAKGMLNTIALMTDTIWWMDSTSKERVVREHQNYCKLLNCLIGIAENDRTIKEMTALEIQTVREVANEKIGVSARAEVILTAITGEKFVHLIKKIAEVPLNKKEPSREEEMKESKKEKNLRLIPNPATNEVHLETNYPNGEVVFYDLMGKVVKQVKLETSKTSLNTSTWVSGVYFYEYKMGNQKERGKLIIAK